MTFSQDLRTLSDDVLTRARHASSTGDELWESLVMLDWTTVGIDEAAGGAGGELADAVEIAAAVGRHAVQLPVVQTGMSAWALAECGLSTELAVRGAVIVRAEVDAADRNGQRRISCAVADVTWLPEVPAVVVVGTHGSVDVVDVVDTTVTKRRPNPAGEPVADLVIADCLVAPGAHATGAPGLVEETRARELLLRAAAIAGAVERVCQLTVQHVQTREQFGRPLIALQSVAHVVANMIVERDRVIAAVQEALLRPDRSLATVAAITAAEAADVVAASAHQLHGAIGVTEEHDLHLFTKRLWSWRDAPPSPRLLDLELGELVLGADSDELLWALVTGGTQS